MVQIIQSQPTIRQNALTDSISQFAQNAMGAYQDAQKTKRQMALQDMDTAFKLREAGYEVDPGMISQAREQVLSGVQEGQTPIDLYGKRTQQFTDKQALEKAKYQREMEEFEQNKELRKSTIQKNNFEMGQEQAMAPFKRQEKLADIEYKRSQVAKNNYDLSGNGDLIPGFKKVVAGKTSEKDKEELKKMSSATKNVISSAESLINNVQQYGITSGFNLTEGSRNVSQDLTDLQLQAKEMYNLGVLNGPDLTLVNSAVGRLQGPVDMLNPFNSKESAIAQIKSVIDKAKTKLNNTAQARGYALEGYDSNHGQNTRATSANAAMKVPAPGTDPGFEAWKKSKGLK